MQTLLRKLKMIGIDDDTINRIHFHMLSRHVDKLPLEGIHNIRLARTKDTEKLLDYRAQYLSGCCEDFDTVICCEDTQEIILFGFNHGHTEERPHTKNGNCAFL